jgi:hypothetical protein
VLGLGDWASELVRSWERRAAGAHLVRYEDLVLAPRETLAALLEYLGVGHDDQTVAAMVDALGSELPVLAEHTTTPDANASVGRWETDLSDELKRACESSFAEALEVFGYRTG